MNKFFIIISVVILSIGGWFLLSSGSSTTPNNPTDTSSLTSLQELKFKDLDNKLVTLAQFSGKPIIVNAWASWCPFCIMELPDFAKIQQELGDSLTIIAINRSETQKTINNYIEESGLDGQLIFWQDSNDKLYRHIGGFAMPETLFINPQGKIVSHRRGFLSEEDIRAEATKLVFS